MLRLTSLVVNSKAMLLFYRMRNGGHSILLILGQMLNFKVIRKNLALGA